MLWQHTHTHTINKTQYATSLTKQDFSECDKVLGEVCGNYSVDTDGYKVTLLQPVF